MDARVEDWLRQGGQWRRALPSHLAQFFTQTEAGRPQRRPQEGRTVVFDRNEREPWQSDDEPEDASWSLEHPLGDPEAWRGDADSTDAESADAWRESPAGSEWPEWDAGPEYQMWKRIAEDDEGSEL